MSYTNQLIDTLQCVGALLERTDKERAEKSASDQSTRSAIGEAVDSCVANGRIEPGEKEALARALADHGQAVRFIAKLAAHRVAESAPRLGSETSRGSAKRAAAGSVDSPSFGLRGAQPRPSDLAWAAAVGQSYEG